MKRTLTLGLAAALAAGCGADSAPDAAMTDMSAEDHSAHLGGGSGGARDSTGAILRQAVQITAEQERALGVVYVTVQRENLTRTIRTVGTVQAAEPNVVDVTPKIGGFVERLFVDFTGDTVRSNQPLLTLYSPELVATQEELLTAKRLVETLDPASGESYRNAVAMLNAARRRLSYWDISDPQVQRIEETGLATKTLTLVAPVNGIVMEKRVVEGQRVAPGERLYRIADLSEVWIEGEVFERDLQYVREGTLAHIEVAAYPGEHRMGSVSFVYPTVDVQSRTNRMRVLVPNRDLQLKPGMFATVYFDAPVGSDVLTVPFGAVIVTGERNLVFVHAADGSLVPREVQLGARAADRVQILSGLREGESIVAAANFLIDAESRLAGTGGAMPGMQHAEHGMTVPPSPAPPDTAGDEEHQHD